MVAQAPAKPGQTKGEAPPVRKLPFPVGVLKVEDPDYDVTKTLSSGGPVQFDNHSFNPIGWLRGFWYEFIAASSGNTNTVTLHNDNPWSVIQKFTLKDKGNREVFGPITGYDWMTVNKFGGYHAMGDPRADLAYSTTTSSASTAGSFTFLLYLPLELVARDALGTVESKSSSSAWKAELFADTPANTYNQVPSSAPTLRVRATQDGYTEPGTADAFGRPYSETPPAPGALQYWVSEDNLLPSGTASYIVTNGIGYSIRNLIFKFIETSGGTRAAGDADWPDPATLTYGKVQLMQRYKNIWISKMGRAYGMQLATGTANAAGTSTPDSANQRENGVFPVPFCNDFGLEPGAELRNGYLVTKTGTVLKLSGSWGAAGTLWTLVNYVIPPGNDPGTLRPGG